MEKQCKWSDGNSVVNITAYVLSNFEEYDDNDNDDDVKKEETETCTEVCKLTYLVFIH